MLARHMVGYAPALFVTSFLAFAALKLFTSLMSPAEYGQFSLTISAMTMLIGIAFLWLQNTASRLLPQTSAEGRETKFLATLYGIFSTASAVLMVVTFTLTAAPSLGDWRVAAWFAAPLAVLRALLNINQSIHRNFVRIGRYNMIEIGQAVIGLAASVILVATWHFAAMGAAMGAMIGYMAMVLFDWRMLKRAWWKDFDWKIFKEIVHFGSPFIITYGLSFILSGSDRFLIQFFLGPDQVGIYSAGYAFPDRVGQNIFMAVATASFPLVVRRLEQEGLAAARDQTYANGVAIFALAVPSCIGLLLVNRQIAATLIGPDFREGARIIMPLIAIATIFSGVAAHYFDHAFQLAKKTRLFFYTLGPAALLNFVGNLYAIPRFGIVGAAYTTVAAYALYLGLSIVLGRRVFPIHFPVKPVIQIAISTGIMAVVLVSFDVPENIVGLITKVLIGSLVYTLGIGLFDVMSVRTRLLTLVMRQNEVVPKRRTDGLRYETLTSQAQIEKIAGEWHDLHRRSTNPVFGTYEWFFIWWRNLGQLERGSPYVIAGRTPTGELKAVLPLVIRRSGALRILEWSGYEVFDFGDVVAERKEDVECLWRHVCAVAPYDVALLKDVSPEALSLLALRKLMFLRGQQKNYFLTLAFATGETWLAAQSRKLRGDNRRKAEKLEAQGAVRFHVFKEGDELPPPVIDELYEQKLLWFRQRYKTGCLPHAGMKSFLQELAQDAARRGILYLSWMSCGDTIVACHLGFVKDQKLLLYLTSYKDTFRSFSPGNMMMIETIKWAIDRRLEEVDFMRGDEPYKQRFASGTRTLSTFIRGRSLLGRAVVNFRLRRGTATLPTAEAGVNDY